MQATDQKNMFRVHTSDQRLKFGICKRYLQLNKKKVNSLMKIGERFEQKLHQNIQE